MYEFLNDSKYLRCRDNEDYYHFGFIDLELLSWDEILIELDREYKIHINTDNKNIFKYQDRLGFILHKFNNINSINNFLKAISNSHHRINQTYTALAYISLSSESATYGRHNDVMDVWCWQMTGYTLWRVEGRKRNFEKILEPGELIYVPRGMWHDTKPMTPRAGLSLGAENMHVNHE